MSEKTDGQHEARLDALEESRKENRQVLAEIFRRLDGIAIDIAAMKSKPMCPDPGSCKRLEAALVDQNRRLVRLELERQRTMGERTAIGSMCLAIGTVVGWLLTLFHGK